MKMNIGSKDDRKWKVYAVLSLICILLLTSASLGFLSYVMKQTCADKLEETYSSCSETFIKISSMNVTQILESYEYCALLTNSTYLKEISKTCDACINATVQ